MKKSDYVAQKSDWGVYCFFLDVARNMNIGAGKFVLY